MDSILIVDDNSKNIQLLATVLVSNGYNVEYTLNGKDAIEIIKSENFELILLDIMMPELDGFDTCLAIKKIKKDIPVIFLTAKTDIDSITKSFETGGVDYITKPFNDKELLKRIEIHIELKKARQQLEQVNSWLELQVEERTKELNVAKKDLEKANNQLINVDKRKTNFLSLLCQEIRNPLNSISGFLYLIKKQNKIEGLEKYINPLDSSVKRLEEFSTKAFLLTEITSCSLLDLNMQDINLREMVLFAINNQSPKIDKKKLKFHVENIDSNVVIKGDDNYILKCFEYLIENATDFSTDESDVYINLIDTENETVFEIRDSGPGFSDEILKNRTNLFFPDDYNNKKTGLSLAIVSKVMEKHEGELSLQNLNPGASVSLHFSKKIV
jgi:two-component system, sensor histidine kinase and response regulator